MTRPPNFQHIPYVPSYEREFWEVVLDFFLPPVVWNDGTRFDQDYVERVYFHVLGVGGPGASFEDRYQQPAVVDKILDHWDAYTKWREDRRLKKEAIMQERRMTAQLYGYDVMEDDDQPKVRGSYLSWLVPKTILRCFGRGSAEGQVDDEEAQQEEAGATERTSLLRHASLYSNVPSGPTSASETSQPVPTTSSLPDQRPICSSPFRYGSFNATTPPTKAPSAIPGRRNSTLSRIWSGISLGGRPRSKSVRFSGVHDVVVYDKLPGEPTGCYEPNYSHLIQPRPDPQIDLIVSTLLAVSSASKPSPSPPPSTTSSSSSMIISFWKTPPTPQQVSCSA